MVIYKDCTEMHGQKNIKKKNTKCRIIIWYNEMCAMVIDSRHITGIAQMMHSCVYWCEMS